MILLLALVGVIVALIVLQAVAGFYANFLWFHYTGVGEVWSGVTLTKVLLVLVSFLLAFSFLWGTLYLVDWVVARTLFLAPDTELVRRFQAMTRPHAVAVRTVVAGLLALALASGSASQWQNWMLLTHSVQFGQVDPLFHRDLSFFVFELPFVSYLVDWIFGVLLVAFVATAIAYFLNGAIRFQRSLQVEPRAIAHLSLILSLMALERAWAYFYVDRFALDLSNDAFVSGAGYTDVHVRLPAMELLAVVSLVAFVMLAFNVYRRTWALPAIAIGLWAFLAIVLGVIYPKLVQALHVTPAQSTLEKPYISDNIANTTAAYGIGKSNVSEIPFPANQDLTPAVLQRYASTLDSVQVWDPEFTHPTFQRLQGLLSYYSLTNLTIDRYQVGGQTVPVDIAVRALNTSAVPSQTWVSTHLQFTHGYAAVVAPANTTAPSSGGTPAFALGSVPVTTSSKAFSIKQPAVYFAPGDSQYVVANTREAEVDYQLPDGTSVTSSYKGDGGIPIGSFWSRLSFAVKLHDFNLLISGDITPHSRLIYIPNVQAEVQKALPFLRVDSNPYAVIDNGNLEWVVDAYTTTAYYPYSEPARTDELGPNSALQGNYNYVRDAVKVVINAYTGKMSFYTIDPTADPLIEAYENAFPQMFKPLKSLETTDPVLLQHLRYPQDLLAVQSAMYGRYHITDPSTFYGQGNAWDLSQISTGVNGSPSETLPKAANGETERYSPIYELLQLPGQSNLSFDAIEPLVPISQNGTLQTLTALMVAGSAYPTGYGHLEAYVTPTGSSGNGGNLTSSAVGSGGAIQGPGYANALIQADPDVSQKITLLDQSGSSVTLGTVQVLPLADSLLYVRALYVSSSQTAYPTLQDVVVVYGKQVSLAPTLAEALAGVFGSSPSGVTSGNSSGSGSAGTTTIPTEVRNDIAAGVQAYSQAQAALQAGDLGTYQQEMTKAGQLLQQANELLAQSSAGASKSATHGSPKSALAPPKNVNSSA
jgi:uncharacterized protein